MKNKNIRSEYMNDSLGILDDIKKVIATKKLLYGKIIIYYNSGRITGIDICTRKREDARKRGKTCYDTNNPD